MAPDARRKLEQIRLSKQKKAITKVNDLRQLIKKKAPETTLHRSPERTNRKGAANNRMRPNSAGSRDLRDSNLRKIATRANPTSTNRINQPLSRNAQTIQGPRSAMARSTAIVKRTVSTTGQLRSEKKYPARSVYVPPHLQSYLESAAYQESPAYSTKPGFVNFPAKRRVANVTDNQYASILVSNLPTSITQSEIIEIFNEMGAIISVNLINPTTALVTFQNANDAVRAVKINNSRLLDDKPMIVNMMPNRVV